MGTVFQKLEEEVSSAFTDVVDFSLQTTTGGLVGFNEDGFRKGVTGEVVVDTLKDVTGANALEAANDQAQARFKQEEDARAKAQEDARNAQYRDQLRASNIAGAARGTSARGGRGSGASGIAAGGGSKGNSLLGSDVQDFLGL